MKPISEIWIDALDFEEKGGWKEDTQFVHLMGSGYLIAADVPGVPVEDARLEVTIPEAGKYRAWVRDRNWLRWHSPGTFNLIVNGENNGRALGALPSDAWVWEIAGDYDLAAGPCSIALHDLTGYFGRCASILLTTDPDYVPPREVGRLQKERARIRGLDAEEKYGGDYEVIVVGGGPGGVPAAIASAREGAKTLLLQDRPMLGGNGSREVGVTFDGASVGHTYAREGGIAEEIRRLRDADPVYYGDWTRAMEKLTAAEENLTVVCNQHVYDVEMADEITIAGVRTQNTRTLEHRRYTGRIFIDCTGDAWVGYYAGAKYHYGREAQYEYGESYAPEMADIITMSGCIKSGGLPFFEDKGEPVEYHAPDWVPKLPEDDKEFGRIIKGPWMHWWMEAPNDYDDMWDGEETRDALLMVVLGAYDHMKNHWEKRESILNQTLRFSSVFNGRRESRRLIGDYVLTQDDCTSGRMFDDAVTYSGWALDVHHPKGIYSGKEGPLYCAVRVPLPKVPYRCLYSKNINNLLFAGRNVSATHIAIGTLRVQNTIATMGQAAGTAAALCIRLDECPRGIYQRHIHELQQLLLKNDQYIPGLKNEDPGDPCLTSTVAASSVSHVEIFKNKHGTDGPLLPLNVARSTVFGLSRKHDRVDNLYVKLYSTRSEPCQVTLHAHTEGDLDTAPDYGEVVTAEATVPPGGENWVCFPVNIVKKEKQNSGGYLRVWLDPAEGIFWRSIETLSFYRLAGELKEDGTWDMTYGRGFYVQPQKPADIPANCAPENVINGYSRILDAERYEWVSDPEQALPQWIELTFAKPAEIDTVSLVFDTDMTNPGTPHVNHKPVKIPGVPQCVKDYDVEIFTGDGWRKIAETRGNFMRKQTHRFDAAEVEKIRVTVLATWGDKSARIMEIRAKSKEAEAVK